jgi:hypothetical protein
MIPRIEKSVFDEKYFIFLQEYFKNNESNKNKKFDYYGSQRTDSYEDDILEEALNKLLPKAKKIFNNEKIVPTYAIFAEYSGEQAMLDHHKDVGPCTYTIDLGLYHNTPWPLNIEGKEYTFLENEAVVFYANDQEHWKPPFPDPEGNRVGIILFHYVDTNHWWRNHNESTQKLLRRRFKAI